MKMIAMFILSVLAILATPETVSAQYYGGYDPRVDQIRAAITGGYYGGYNQPRGYFDPYRTDGRDIYGRKLPPIEVEECEYRECYGRKGTFHSEKGVMHFRMHDSTHNPFNMNHKNCIVIRSVEQVEEGSGPVRAESVQEPEYNERPTQTATRETQFGPVDNSIDITWETMNNTEFQAIVTDPTTGKKKLIPAGGTIRLPDPVGDEPYTVVLLEPGRGKSNQIQAEIRPTKNLQGWEIVASR